MAINLEISIGDIIALLSLIGSIIVLILTIQKHVSTKGFAENADAFNSSAKKYYDLMVQQINYGNHNRQDFNSQNMQNRACCDANIVKISSNKWILKVFNKGKASAKNVTFRYLVDDAPIVLSDNPFPIKHLEPQKGVDYHLIVHMGMRSSSWDYEITWVNEDDTADRKEGILTLPLS